MMDSPRDLGALWRERQRRYVRGAPLSFAGCQMLGVVTPTETARETQGRIFLCFKKWICLVLADGQRHSS